MLNPATALTILIGWCALAATMYGVTATLYVGGKMSSRSFRTTTRLFLSGIFFPIIVVLALFLYCQGLYIGALLVFIIAGFCLAVYWQREKLVIAWRYLAIVSRYIWPPLALVITIALPVAAVHLQNPLVIVLSMAFASCAVYLLSPHLGRHRQLWPAVRRKPWRYDFIEHLKDESTKRYIELARTPDDPFLVYKVENARSATQIGEAIFEHPPHHGDGVIEFMIAGIDERVTGVRLEGSYGIMDRFKDRDGTPKESTFQAESGNKVRFEIWVNRQKKWEDELADFGWRWVEKGPFEPQQGCLVVDLRTNAMDQTHCNWAAWRELKLVEQV